MPKKSPYAVMDGNEAPDQFRYAESCHMTLRAAVRERDRLNKGDPNSHFYVVSWDATRWAKEHPAPEHPQGLEE